MSERVDGGVDQVLGAELDACLSDGEDLGVGGRIVCLGHLVGALGEDFAVLDDHRREWTTALGHVLAGEVDGPLGKVSHSSGG